jgi:hypothetical protein
MRIARTLTLVSLCLAVWGAAGAEADERERRGLRRLAVADVGEAYAEEGEAWEALAEPAFARAVEPGDLDRYRASKELQVWRAPRQAGLPAGATLVAGRFLDQPSCEAAREDRAFLAVGAGGSLDATWELPPNASGAAALDLVSLGGPTVLVVVRGRIWRGGDYLQVLRWSPGQGQLEGVYGVGGEGETTPDLCYSLESGPQPQLVVYGLAREDRVVLTLGDVPAAEPTDPGVNLMVAPRRD